VHALPAFRPKGRWDEDSAKRLVEELGFRTPRRIVCRTREEAREALAQLDAPVVVKVLHPDVLHKADAGGVHLGIADEAALERALEAIDRIGPIGPIDRNDRARYLLEETAPPGPELILGARRDPVFGPLVALGAGGAGVEANGDLAVRLAPLTAAEAASMLGGVDIAGAVVAFGALIAGRDDIAEVEVNPLRVTADGLIALDALVVAS
jgi:acetyltransferase